MFFNIHIHWSLVGLGQSSEMNPKMIYKITNENYSTNLPSDIMTNCYKGIIEYSSFDKICKQLTTNSQCQLQYIELNKYDA